MLQILAILFAFVAATYFTLKYVNTDNNLIIHNERQWQVIQLLLSRLADVSTEEYFEDTLAAVEVLLGIDIEKSEEEK